MEVTGAEATPWGACPTKGAVTHQTHHTLPKGPQGLQTPGSNTTRAQVLGKGQAGQTSWQTWKEPLGSRILSSLHSQCPESHPFFLLLKKSTFKPDTLRELRVAASALSAHSLGESPHGGMSELSSTQIRPFLQDPAHSSLLSKPISLPPS